MKELQFDIQHFANIDGTNGDDNLYNKNSNVAIYGYGGDDYIRADRPSGGGLVADYVTVYAGDGNDSVSIYLNRYNKVYGGAGDDSIYNDFCENSTVDGGEGNDTIEVWAFTGHSINGGNGNDYILMQPGEGSTVKGGLGNDTIRGGGENYGKGAKLYQYAYGDGYDIIYDFCGTLSITGTSYTPSISGDDFIVSMSGGAITLVGAANEIININGTNYITNNTSSKVVNGTSNNDFILNTGETITINADEGNDSIYNTSYRVKIYGENGSDTIQNYGTFVSVDAGTGNDSIYNRGNQQVYLNAGADNDTINATLYFSTATGGNGDDFLNIYGYDNSIDGGAGADKISVYSSDIRNTIKGGANNDTIYDEHGNNGGVLYQYESNVGNDTIYGVKSNDTLQITGTSYTTVQSGSDILVSVEGGSILLKGGGCYISGTFVNPLEIVGTSYNDSIFNTLRGATIRALAGNDSIENGVYSSNYSSLNASMTIDGGDGNDSIKNYAHNVSIIGGYGQDYIYNYDGSYPTIYGGYGSDTIYSYGLRSYLDGGDGNDSITATYFSYNTIYGGYGDDTIYSGGQDAKISGGADNDKITVYGAYSNVDAGTGNDSIYAGSASYSYVDAGNGDDSIYSSSNYLTVKGGYGNDIISLTNSSKNNLIQYASGDDNDNIYGLKSSDTLHVTSGSVSSSVASGEDVIITVGSGTITLKDAAGKTTYLKIGTNSATLITLPSEFKFTNNGDTYANTKSSTVLNALGGNDSVSNSGNYVTINGGNGNDTVINSASNVTINGESGSDSISNSGQSAVINGGADNDTVINSASYVTIIGGASSDSVSLSSSAYNNVIKYSSGDGYDTVYGYDSNDTISLGGGYYTRSTVGNNVVVSLVSGGAITLSGANGKTVNIVGGTLSVPAAFTNGADYYSNSKAGTVLNALSGNDTVINSASNVTINGDSGVDSISNSGQSAVINGGADNDTVINSASYVTIIGAASNDLISLSSSAYNNVIKYSSGDGYDTVYGLKSNDTLNIIEGSISKSVASGEDVILTVGNGTITLKNIAGLTTYLKIGNNTATKVTLPSHKSSISQQNVIEKFANALDTIKGDLGKSAVSKAVSIASGGYFKNEQELITSMINARSKYATGKTGSIEYLKKEFDIDLTDKDTGAILGSNTGGAKVLNAEDIIPEFGDLDTRFEGDFFIVDGIKFTLAIWTNFGDQQYKLISYNDLKTADQQYLWQAMKTWWVEEGLNVIEDSYGYSFEDKNSTVKENLIMFVNDPNDESTWGTGFQKNALQCTSYLDYYWDGIGWKNIYKTAITFNMNYYYNFDSSTDKNGISPEGQIYFDRCLTHEMTHAIMSSNVDYYCNLPAYIKEGFCEVVHGGDFRANGSMIPLANNLDMLQKVYNNSSGYVTNDKQLDQEFKNKGIYNPDYGAGIMLLRYLAKQGSEHYGQINMSSSSEVVGAGANSGITLSGTFLTVDEDFSENQIYLSDYSNKITKVDATRLKDDIMVVGNSKANVLEGGSGNDNIYGNAGNDTLIGGVGNDILHAEAGNNSLVGNAGNDTLYAGSGNDTLVGGSGKDIFYHYTGNVYVMDYTVGQDKIRLNNYDVITGSSIKDNDVILNVRNTSILVKDGIGKKITIIDGFGEETTKIYGDITSNLPNGWKYGNTAKTNLSASVSSAANIDLTQTYGTSVVTVDGSKATKAVSITGNIKNNSLKGGSNSDTLNGGSGNDTLTGGSGKDVFIYESGNDWITDYKAGEDKIKLSSGSITSASLSGSNVVLKTSNGLITVKSGKGKKLTIIDANGNETTDIYPADNGVSVKGAIVTVSAKFTGNKIDLKDYNGATKVNASAVSQSLNMAGNSSNNSLKGGKGADTISGGSGNDTVSLGGGKDIYIYSSGNDYIQDYTAGADKIKLTSGSISGASVSSSNVILNISNGGKITVKGGKDKEITVIDSKDKETTKIYGRSDIDTLPVGISIKNSIVTAASTFKGNKIDLADYSKATKVNTEAVSQAVSIVGSAANNSLTGGKGADNINGGAGKDTLYGGSGNDKIYGGNDNDKLYGDAGNDSLFGGSGNDTFTGSDGKDVFVYEGGKDVITDYTAGQDKIKISSGKISKTMYKNKDVVFTIGDGTLTVKNAKGKEISVTNGSQTQTYSQTFDLLYDCNFMTDEFQIDDVSSISDTNYSVGQITYSHDNDKFVTGSIVSVAYLDKK